MTKDNTNFIDPSKKTLYGKDGAQFWIGKIVAYADQKEQIEEGFGWRYKVRILGDNSDTDQVEDQYLTYATVILPTTAGTGGAFKLRSVRLSQGDMVFGVRGGGTAAPKFIIGALPRTRKTTVSKDKFGTLSGFYGSLNSDSEILDGEHNEQIGPTTPGVTALPPKTYNKSNRENPSGNLEQLGYDQNQDGVIDDVEEKLNPPTVAGDRKWDEGEPINSAQVEYILSNQIQVEIMEDDKDKPLISNDQIVGYEQVGTGTFETVNLMETEESSAYTRKVLDQAVTQNLVTKEIADKALVDLTNGNPEVALERIFPPPPPTSD